MRVTGLPSSLKSGPVGVIGCGENTVTLNEVVSVRLPASVTVRLIVDVPVWLNAGVINTVRLPPLPPKKMFPTGITVGFDDCAVTIRNPFAVSRSSTVNGITGLGWFTLTITSAIGFGKIVGLVFPI